MNIARSVHLAFAPKINQSLSTDLLVLISGNRTASEKTTMGQKQSSANAGFCAVAFPWGRFEQSWGLPSTLSLINRIDFNC
jgi:hypothetical protein